jgi:hypothetical protein
MLTATFLGPFLVPMFYLVVVDKLRRRRAQPAGATLSADGGRL